MTSPRPSPVWWVVTLAVVGAGLPMAARADEDAASRMEPRGHGRFMTRAAKTDSLDYSSYRLLPDKEQLHLREEAKRFGRSGRQQKDPQSAQHLFATAVGLCPYWPEGWLLYAKTQIDLGDDLAAESLLDQVQATLHYEPDQKHRNNLLQDYHHFRALVTYNRGEMEASLGHLGEAREVGGRNNEDALLLEARTLAELGRFDAARRTLTAFNDRSPLYAQSLSVLALVEMRAGDLGASEHAFKRAHKFGMRGAVFENDWGRMELERGRSNEAIERFQAAIERSPRFMEARNNLAVAYRRGQRFDEAEAVLLEAVDVEPSYGAVHFNLAEFYRERLENLSGAAADSIGGKAWRSYTTALALGYDPHVVQERRGSLALAVDNLDAANLDQAEADLLALADSPDTHGKVLYMLGRVKKEQGNLEIAERLFRLALERDYEVATLQADLGEVLLRRGNPTDASAALQRAAALDPKLVVTRVNLSVALSQLGKLQAADKALKEAESLAPQHPLVRHQRKVLTEMMKKG